MAATHETFKLSQHTSQGLITSEGGLYAAIDYALDMVIKAEADKHARLACPNYHWTAGYDYASECITITRERM